MDSQQRKKFLSQMEEIKSDPEKVSIARGVFNIASEKLAQKEKATFRSWVKASGLASILLGGLGLMPTFFVPSVIAIYSGLLVLAVDIFFENIRTILRVAVVLFLVGIAIAFTKTVVLRRDPIDIYYMKNLGGSDSIDIMIKNNTVDDFKVVDLHVDLPQEVFVVGYRKITDLATCSLFPADQASAHLGERAVITQELRADGTSKVTAMVGNYQRVRCEVLPHQSMFEMRLNLREGEKLNAPPDLSKISVSVDGEYDGKFRTFTAPKEAYLSKGGLRGWTQSDN